MQFTTGISLFDELMTVTCSEPTCLIIIVFCQLKSWDTHQEFAFVSMMKFLKCSLPHATAFHISGMLTLFLRGIINFIDKDSHFTMENKIIGAK